MKLYFIFLWSWWYESMEWQFGIGFSFLAYPKFTQKDLQQMHRWRNWVFLSALLQNSPTRSCIECIYLKKHKSCPECIVNASIIVFLFYFILFYFKKLGRNGQVKVQMVNKFFIQTLWKFTMDGCTWILTTNFSHFIFQTDYFTV